MQKSTDAHKNKDKRAIRELRVEVAELKASLLRHKNRSQNREELFQGQIRQLQEKFDSQDELIHKLNLKLAINLGSIEKSF